ncbi:MAG: hypothetical protein H7338_02800, partial [Candidatus Sericytochromatia bacterium]|nr:hypothetical protein [Candidatus Sericytochromatia bacterium]
DTTIWNVVGAPVVDAAGVHIDNFSGGSEGITSIGRYTGSRPFDVAMRFGAFPTNVSVASDYALGLQGGGANAPHILVTDGAYPGSTFNDTDGGIADGPNAYFHTGVASATSMPPGPLAANGLPYHSAPQSTVYLWKPGSIVDGQFHKYRLEWTPTSSKFYFDGNTDANLVSWSNLGAVGTSTVAFQFANHLAAGAGTAITVRDFSFITNNPITINGMVPGMKAEVRDRSGILVGNGTANALGAVTLPTTILTPMPYTGAQIWVYAADGTFVGSQTLTDSSGLNGGDTYSVSMFQFAKFDDLSRLAWSKIGNQYLDAGTQVGTFLSSGTMGAGKLIRYALEASNTSVQQLAPEISLAKTVYANLTKVLEAKIMNLDAIMALIR